MLETVPRQSRTANTEQILDRLERDGSPALVLAPIEARVIAANVAGAAVLGLSALLPYACRAERGDQVSRSNGRTRDAETHPAREHVLDSTMPAVARLRRLLVGGAVSHEPSVEPLVFWTASGARRIVCRIRLIDDAAEDDRLRVLVEPLDAAIVATPAPSSDARWRPAPAPPLANVGAEAEACEPAPAPTVAPSVPEPITEGAFAICEQAPAEAASHDTTPAPRAGGERASARTDADILRAIARQILSSPASTEEPAERASLEPPPQPETPETPEPPAEAVSEIPPTATASTGDAQHRPHTERPQPRPGSPRRVLARRLAHELKSPLSAIVAAAEIMKDERFGPIGDERYLRYVRDIHESARHTLDVIQRILGAHVEGTTTAELSFTNLDVNAVIASLLSSSAPLAAAAGIVIVEDLAPGLPLVIADATSLRQIILNLISNALKFTPKGGLISVRTSATLDGPLAIEVTDSGRGMSDAEIERALDGPEPEIAPRGGGGFGIGLPLVRSLAAANGATLALARCAEGGLVATITFPKSRQVLL